MSATERQYIQWLNQGWKGTMTEKHEQMLADANDGLLRFEKLLDERLTNTGLDSMEEVNTGRNIINSVNDHTCDEYHSDEWFRCERCYLESYFSPQEQKEVDAIRKQYEKASKEADYERARGVV